MAFDGSGNFSRPVSSYVFDTIIDQDDVNTEMDGIATGLSNALCKDGQQTATGNQPMGGYRHTGVGNASARTHYAVVGQIQDGDYLELGSVAGTDTITASASPSITAYAQGQTFRFVAAGTNTGATTLNVNSVGAKAIQKLGAALVAGDITSGDAVAVYYDGTQFQMLTPARTPVLTAGGIAFAALGDTIDEDDMASDSATKLPTQQSTKAYVDAHGLVQMVSVEDGAVATGTTTMANDDTIPQNTEGTEFMTLAITPTNASNNLEIDVLLNISSTVDLPNAGHIAALFQDATADAIAAGYYPGPTGAAGDMWQIRLRKVMTAGTTSATTFKVRAGPTSAGTVTVNGASGSRLLGGVLLSSIVIKEIQA